MSDPIEPAPGQAGPGQPDAGHADGAHPGPLLPAAVHSGAAPLVAVDAMGGDHAPDAIVAGAVAAAREHGLRIALTGRPGQLRPLLAGLGVTAQGAAGHGAGRHGPAGTGPSRARSGWSRRRTRWTWARVPWPVGGGPGPASPSPASWSGAGRPRRWCRPARRAPSWRRPGCGCGRCLAYTFSVLLRSSSRTLAA